MTAVAPFAYFGGKARLADRIVQLLPEHDHYVEPFAGSLAVLLAKPRAAMETVNDLDGHLMTFWRVLRNRPEDLTRVCALTPHARAEHDLAYSIDGCDELEVARRVWVRLSQGRSGTLRRTGWRHDQKPYGGLSMPGRLAAYIGRVPDCAERLVGVSLECRDALEVIDSYGRNDEVLLYCDPPYVGTTREANYRCEMTGEKQHRDLAAALASARAAVVLSGYHSPLYDELYDGWHRSELKAWTGNGVKDGKAEGNRTEVLWSNRPFPNEDLRMFEVTA